MMPANQDPAIGIDPVKHPYWRPVRDVLWCTHGDLTFLLSLTTGKYHTLDEAGGTIWRHVCAGEPLDAVARRVAEEYGPSTNVDEVLAHSRELLADLSARRLMEPGRVASTVAERVLSGPPPREGCAEPREPMRTDAWRPSVFGCVVRLFVVYVLLRTIGFRRLLNYIGRSTPVPLISRLSTDWIEAASTTVGKAVVWAPFRVECLEHSVCLWWVIRRAGGAVDLRIGVQPFPFMAHAWVEYDGRPLNDSPEHVALFKAFPAIAVGPVQA